MPANRASGPQLEPNQKTPQLEDELGMSCYLTDTPGIEGKLRTRPEDFEVHEDSAPIAKAQAAGKYTLARVRARNWETNRLIRELAKRLGIPRRSIYFTGTKDKRAVTVQNLALAAAEEQVNALDLEGVEVLETHRVDRAPKLGEHAGNRFRVKIRGFEVDRVSVAERVEEIQDTLLEEGGFLNYFGPQRFGSVRPVTHLVGRELVQGTLEDAVWTYIAYPTRFDPPEVQEDRERLWETRDVEQAIQKIPRRFDYEHDMLAHLDEQPGDHAGALTQLPLNLTRMFVAAYQSWLFNQAVSQRAQEAHPKIAEVGDLLHPADEDGVPDPDRSIPVTERNLRPCIEATRSGKGFPTAALPGYESELASGLQGTIEAGLLQEEDLSPDAFRILELPKISMGGTRRAMWCPLDELEVATDEDEHGVFVRLEFFLPKGSYATCLLREFMKTDPARY